MWNGLYGIYLPGGRYLFRSVLIGILVASFTLGSFPAGVGAYQLSQLRQDLVSALSGAALAQADMDAELQRMNDTMASNASSAEPAVPMPLSTEFETGGGHPQPEVSRADARELEEPAIAESEPKDQGAGGGSLENSAGSESQEPTQGDGEGGVDIADDAAVPDSMTSAEQDASAIEGAEVLQQGDGEKSGNVLLADRAAVDALGGRDFAGQVVKEIGGRKYILIGNEQQLRAIGSGKKVHTAVYQAVLNGVHWEVDKGKDGKPIMLYGGDADLLALQNGKKDYTLGEIDRADGDALEAVGQCGVNQTTGEIDPNMDIKDSGVSYAADANYIIFRDIDLGTNAADPTNTGWTPLMFSSIMLGAKSGTPDTAGSLWDCIKQDGLGITDVTKVVNPVISNVKVVQSDAKLDVSKYTGIGFFGTISNKLDDKNPFAVPTKATVSNITLEKVSVENHATEVRVDQSLISGLLGVLSGAVGGLLSTLLKILTGGLLDLGGLVENLLNVRAADPSSLATGAFAGRVVGDVEVSGCEVHEAKVSSAAQMNGGFVGYSQGDTRYDIVSDLLGSIVDLLANLLNIIPGLGLGDLITLLLDSNIIKADALIPVDYLNPVFSHCSVFNFAKGEVIGSVNNDYAGGFAGAMVGTIAQDCSVKSTNPYTVTARLYAGGFAGLMRNDVMKGALSKAGIELLRPAQPQSIAVGCAVRSGVTVNAASYAGGFAGAMANSYAVDASVEGTVGVSATGHEEEHNGKHSIKALAGGFTGAATVGWVTDLGQGESKNSDLLTGVNSLLTGLLTSDPEAAQNLLSLVGVEESKLLGVQMKGEFTVHSANDFAGGMVGRGDGVVIAKSDQDHLKDIKLWGEKTIVRPAAERPVVLDGLRSVEAGQTRAGGVAGMLGTASVGGIINGTVGLGGYLPFELSDVTVTGVTEGAAVTAADSHAAGAVAEATGGSCTNVHIKNIASVQAGTHAGGFAGVAGPGNLAGSGGLDLLGLGAVSVKGLLAVGEGVNVTAENCTVAGHANGFTVAATKDTAPVAGVSAATAGGFVADNHSGQLSNCNVTGLHLSLIHI